MKCAQNLVLYSSHTFSLSQILSTMSSEESSFSGSGSNYEVNDEECASSVGNSQTVDECKDNLDITGII